MGVHPSFNSLQTGKCIASIIYFFFDEDNKMGFNSLQTGKCIASIRTEKGKDAGFQFQFPSNGKVYSKLGLRNEDFHQVVRFQFPSNGKVYSKRPHFKPSGAVPPEPQKNTRTALGFFCLKILPKNPANPRVH